MAEANSDVADWLIGFIGAVIGASIAAFTSVLIARKTLAAAESEWMRESRRAIYDRFLSSAQTLLNACEQHRAQHHSDPTTESRECRKSRESVDTAFDSFFQAYGTVQTVAHLRVLKAVRIYAYRLWELEEEVLAKRPVLDSNNAEAVARSVRAARHPTIDAMREDLRAEGSAKPPADFNPFDKGDDDGLQAAYQKVLKEAGAESENVRPGWEGPRHGTGSAGGEQS